MTGKLEKYPSKIDSILRTLINKCLTKDENTRLTATEMLEYQDEVEYEYFGEVISRKIISESRIEHAQT